MLKNLKKNSILEKSLSNKNKMNHINLLKSNKFNYVSSLYSKYVIIGSGFTGISLANKLQSVKIYIFKKKQNKNKSKFIINTVIIINNKASFQNPKRGYYFIGYNPRIH